MEITDTFESEEDAIAFAMENEMIYGNRHCQCSHEMTISTQRGGSMWYCSVCNTSRSLLAGSFFMVCVICKMIHCN